jgi:hypothetical protein
MSKEKVYVLIHDDVEYDRYDVCGVFTEEGKQKELKLFTERERELNKVLINDCHQYIDIYKRRRTEITTVDTRLLEGAGKNLTMVEIHEHERNLKEIEELTSKIAGLNAKINEIANYSDSTLAQNALQRMHCVFKEFELQ